MSGVGGGVHFALHSQHFVAIISRQVNTSLKSVALEFSDHKINNCIPPKCCEPELKVLVVGEQSALCMHLAGSRRSRVLISIWRS